MGHGSAVFGLRERTTWRKPGTPPPTKELFIRTGRRIGTLQFDRVQAVNAFGASYLGVVTNADAEWATLASMTSRLYER